MNPMAQMMQNNSPIGQFMNKLKNAPNKQQMVNQMAQNFMSQNPQIQQRLSAMQQQCGNGSQKDFVLGQLKNNGADMDQVMQLAKMLGLK